MEEGERGRRRKEKGIVYRGGERIDTGIPVVPGTVKLRVVEVEQFQGKKSTVIDHTYYYRLQDYRWEQTYIINEPFCLLEHQPSTSTFFVC